MPGVKQSYCNSYCLFLQFDFVIHLATLRNYQDREKSAFDIPGGDSFPEFHAKDLLSLILIYIYICMYVRTRGSDDKLLASNTNCGK